MPFMLQANYYLQFQPLEPLENLTDSAVPNASRTAPKPERKMVATSGRRRSRTALHLAAMDGDFAKVENLLTRMSGGSVDVDLLNAADNNGWQAIHEAARGGHLDVLR